MKRFLDAGADIVLSEIDKIGKYRRALEVTKTKIDKVTGAVMKLEVSSWRASERDKDFPGKKMYRIDVIVKALPDILDRIEFVTYRLDSSYPNPVKKITDRKSQFGLKELAWGESTIYADVKIKDENDTITLTGLLTLMEAGKRLVKPEQ